MRKLLFFIPFCLTVGVCTANAAVYLKPLALDETREVQNGSSWSTAYATVADAIANVGPDGVIYCAKGLYLMSEKVTSSASLQIYGGFPGKSEDETLDDRDWSVEDGGTVICGLAAANAKWKHGVPNVEAGTYDDTTTDIKVVDTATGKVNLPPPPSGDYDFYYPSTAGICNGLTLSGGATIDGVIFTGFSSGVNGAALLLSGNACTILNCTFIANTPRGGTINSSVGCTFRACRFLWNKAQTTTSSCITTSAGTTTIADTLFLGCGTYGQGYSASAVVNLTAGPMTNCVFTRCYSREKHDSSLVVDNSGTLSDLVFTNNTSFSQAGKTVPVLTGQYLSLKRCLFAGNIVRATPVAGASYAVVACNWKNRNVDFDGVTFRGNRLLTTAAALAEGSIFTVAPVADYTTGGQIFYHFLNATFDGNTVEVTPIDGVTPNVSYGVALRATIDPDTAQMSFANCTFRGAAGDEPYIAQIGAGHSKDVIVLNSLFMNEGDGVVHPFRADVPSLWKVYDCSVQNLLPQFVTEEFDLTSGLETDAVPFATNGCLTAALQPAVRVPGLRSTADVALSQTSSTRPYYAYRLKDTETWRKFNPSQDGTKGTLPIIGPIADATGAERAYGTFTRGAVQALAEPAETGLSVVVRRDPFVAGTVDPSATAVAVGGRVSLSATSVTGGEVEWVDEDDQVVATGSTYAFTADGDGTRILTARFATSKTQLTFDLEGKGTFAESGEDTYVTNLPAHAAFPLMPSVCDGDSWHFVGWDNLPTSVPTEDATYFGRWITKDVRRVYVVPGGAGACDGSSWENAYGDVAAAYADAGLYRGEVWIKKGTYFVSAAIPMTSNVRLIGGFSGGETEASQASTNNLTVLTGDATGNNVWTERTGGNLRIWEDGVFAWPNPTGADRCWVASGDSGTDTAWCFRSNDETGAATNNVFEKIVFTGFCTGAIEARSGLTDGLAFRDCRFWATTGTANWDVNRALFVKNSDLELTGCEFVGNYFNAWVQSSALKTVVVSNCLFYGNKAGKQCAALRLENTLDCRIDRCRFRRNMNTSIYTDSAATLAILLNSTAPKAAVRDCVIEDNRLSSCYANVRVGDQSAVAVERCVFLDNVMYDAPNETYARATCVTDSSSGLKQFLDCRFEGNICTNSYQSGASVYATASDSQVHFQNCTFVGNRAVVRPNSVATATVLIGNRHSDSLFANCIFKDNEADADIFDRGDGSDYTQFMLGLFNTILTGSAADYCPIKLEPKRIPTILNCCIKNWATVEYLEPTAANYGTVRDVVDVDPELWSEMRMGANGVLTLGVSAFSPVARAGIPLWFSKGGGNVFYYDPTFNAKKPWRSAYYIRGLYTNEEAEESGVTRQTPPIADAWAQPRPARHVSLGPVQAPQPGLMLLVR